MEFEVLEREPNTYLLAVDGGEVVGYARVRTSNPDTEFLWDSFYIEPQHRGTGLRDALVAFGLGRLRGRPHWHPNQMSEVSRLTAWVSGILPRPGSQEVVIDTVEGERIGADTLDRLRAWRAEQ